MFRSFVLAFGAFGLITTELGVIGVLPQIARTFEISIERAGWLLSGFALVVAVSSPFITLLTSGLNRKWCLCGVLALFVASNFASAAAPSFGWLLLLRVLPAFIHPVFWSLAMSLAAASMEPNRSSRAVSVVFTGMSAGIVFGIPIASFVAGAIDWRASFLVFGIVNFVALLAHLTFLPSLPVAERVPTGRQLGVLRKGAVWWNLALQIVITAAVFSIYGYMAEYLGQVAALGALEISGMLFLFGVAGLAGTLIVGRCIGLDLSRTVAGFLVALVPVFLLLFLFGHDRSVIVGLVVLWGLVHAAAVPLCQAVVLRAGPESPEFSNSLFNTFGNIGIVCGTTLGGAAIARFGIAPLPLLSVGLLAVGGLVFAIDRHWFSIPSPSKGARL